MCQLAVIDTKNRFAMSKQDVYVIDSQGVRRYEEQL